MSISFAADKDHERQKELHDRLGNDPDFIRLENTARLIESLRSVAIGRPHNEMTMVAFHNGHPGPEKLSPRKLMKGIAVFNASSSELEMTNQFFGSYTSVRLIELRPHQWPRHLEKLTLESLRSMLLDHSVIFVSRSRSDPEVMSLLAS